MTDRTALHGKLPRGVQDLFFTSAARRNALEARLAGVFRAWGYTQLVPPSFEYFENLALGLSPQVQEATYRFIDHRGHTLALRPDLTVQTARVVGTKLYDQPMPLRFYYIEPVFRYVEVQAGRQREFIQGGIELIGAATAQADAEVVAVAVETLRACGLADVRVSLGHINFFRALLAEAGLSQAEAEAVQRAVDRKSPADVRAAVNGKGGRVTDALVELPLLMGGVEALERARRLSRSPDAHAALDTLSRIYDWLDRAGLTEAIVFDLGEVRGMDYYTGLTFEAFTAGVGFAVLNGGRYDRLVGLFGPDQPAVGFALDVDRVLLALGENAVNGGVPDILVAASDDPACLAAVRALREQGLSVEMDVLARAPADLRQYAAQRGIGEVRVWTDGALAPVESEGAR